LNIEITIELPGQLQYFVPTVGFKNVELAGHESFFHGNFRNFSATGSLKALKHKEPSLT
jgi:hypothetical protein